MYGRPISIGAAFINKGIIKDTFDGKIHSIIGNINLLLPTEYHTEIAMLEDFKQFWIRHYYNDCYVIWHTGSIDESGLFRVLLEKGLIPEKYIPNISFEFSTLLRDRGYTPDKIQGKNIKGSSITATTIAAIYMFLTL